MAKCVHAFYTLISFRRILINNPVGKGEVANCIANLIKYFDGLNQRVKINANKDTITVTFFLSSH